MMKIPKIGTIVIVIGIVAGLYLASIGALDNVFGDNSETGTVISIKLTEYGTANTQTIVVPIDDANSQLSIFNKPQYGPLTTVTIPPINPQGKYIVEFSINLDISAATPGDITTADVRVGCSANRYGIPSTTGNAGYFSDGVAWPTGIGSPQIYYPYWTGMGLSPEPETVPLGESTIEMNQASGSYFSSYYDDSSVLRTGGIPGSYFDTSGFKISIGVMVGDVFTQSILEFTTVVGTVGSVNVIIQGVSVTTTQV